MGWRESGRKRIEERLGERGKGRRHNPQPIPPSGPSFSPSSFSAFQPRSDTSSRSLFTGYFEWTQQNGFEAMLYNCVPFPSFPVMMTQILKTWRLFLSRCMYINQLCLTKNLNALLLNYRVIVWWTIFHHTTQVSSVCQDRPPQSNLCLLQVCHGFDPWREQTFLDSQ